MRGLFVSLTTDHNETCIHSAIKCIQKSIKNYFEYFPCGPRELAWGFHVSAAGRTHVRAGQPYPPASHPTHHHFRWETGRILSELQLVFLSAGRGCVEWKDRRREVKGGDCFFLMPGVWHRYRPDALRGWTEHWFEIKGEFVEGWLDKGMIDPECPQFPLSPGSPLPKLFDELHRLCLRKAPGYRPVLAGIALSLVAEALRQAAPARLGKRKEMASRLVWDVQQSLRDPSDIKGLARRLGMSYPTLLRRFRRETGMNPKEYLEQIRMSRAEEFLADGGLEIKEISALLKFHSAFHFSAQFKKSHGISPSVWRRRCLAR